MIYSLVKFFIFLFSLTAIWAQGQEQLITARLPIGESVFQVQFSPSQDLQTVARSFCINQQVALGYTNERPLTEGNVNECVKPIADYLAQQLQQAHSQQRAAATPATTAAAPAGDLYKVNVPIDDLVFEVRFRPDSEPVERVARNLCITQQNALGFNESNPLTEANLPNCVNPIGQYLAAAVAEIRKQAQQQKAPTAPPAPPAKPAPTATTAAAAPAAREIKLRLPIDANVYELTLREGQVIADVARTFCIEQQNSLGYTAANPLTTENIQNCVNPIVEYIQNSLAQYNTQQKQTAPAQAVAPAQTAAAQQPLGDMYSVRLTIAGNTYEVRFRPESEPVAQVASNFCVSQAASLGVTQETLNGCIGPIAEYLNKEVQGLRTASR